MNWTAMLSADVLNELIVFFGVWSLCLVIGVAVLCYEDPGESDEI